MTAKAFTLIELLVVVAIIGILAAVGVVAYNGYTKAAKINATKVNYKIVRDFVSAQVSGCMIGRYPELYNPDGTIKKPGCPVAAHGSLDYFFTHFTYIELKNPYNNQLAVNRINKCGNTIEANGCIELSAPNAYKFVIKSFYTDKDGKQQILGPHTILTEWYLK